MTIAQEFLEKIRDAMAAKDLPKFGGEYTSNADIPTFQAVLNKYAEYYKSLPESAQKTSSSEIFWQQVAALGTPIIEDHLGSDDKCDVYFLFPKDDISVSKEEPGTKKDLYLQGDFHGYDTAGDRQRLEEIPGTSVMLHKDTMPKDAIVNYRYVQLEPSLRGRAPCFDSPPFFGLSPKEEAERILKMLYEVLNNTGQTYPDKLIECHKALAEEFNKLQHVENPKEKPDKMYQQLLDGEPPEYLGISNLYYSLVGNQSAPFFDEENQSVDKYTRVGYRCYKAPIP